MSSDTGYPQAEREQLDDLGATLRSVLESSRSDFYRKHFAGLEFLSGFPKTLAQWRGLPFLSKQEISDTPLWDRTFAPKDQVHAIRFTAGTSGKRSLFTPRRSFGQYGRAAALAGARRMLAFVNAIYMSEASRRELGIAILNCNYPDTPETYTLASTLAKQFHADSLLTFPSTAIELAPYLAESGALSAIRTLEFTGERCSPAQEKALRQLYGDPILVQNYSASEWNGTFGESCTYAIKEGLMSFHVEQEFFFSEFIDPDTLEPADPHRGPAELVISSLTSDQPFPIIRYRTGDLLSVEGTHCPCGDPTPRFIKTARVDADRTRLFSMEFSADAIERALDACPDVAPEDFEAHYIERQKNNIYEHGLKLFVMPRTSDLDLVRTARWLEEHMRVSTASTYAEGVRDGLLLPLQVAILRKPTRSALGKRIRLIKTQE